MVKSRRVIEIKRVCNDEIKSFHICLYFFAIPLGIASSLLPFSALFGARESNVVVQYFDTFTIVTPNSQYNIFSDTTARPVTVEEQCQRGAQLVPHPEECQLYYNCSLLYDVVPRFFEQRLMECKYPQLFDRQLKMCRDFSVVNCDSRKVHKSGCNYRSNMCPRAHCIPCSQTIPSCEGMSDGQNVFISREWSPYYVTCRSERTVETKTCPRDNVFNVPQFFHPEKKKCVNLYRVPPERGGAMPSCERRFNGAHPLEGGGTGTAYLCQGGRLLSIRYCPPGSRPEPEPRSCVYS